MELPDDLPVVDHHCHLSASGDGPKAVRRFADAGGTDLFLATQNYTSAPPLSPEGYQEQFEATERLARRSADETGVRIYLVLAPYPVDLISQVDALGAPGATRLQEAALEIAGRWVREHRAVAIGEVGRPHFPVPPRVAETADAVFRRALETARDAGCPAVVHSEELTPDGFRELSRIAAQSLLPVGRLVKHYTTTVRPPSETHGIVPSYLAKKEIVMAALGWSAPWFLETDYLDDPGRPGAVLDLATVPKRVRALIQGDPESAEKLRVPFVDSVRSVYGIEPGPRSASRP